MKFGCGLSGVGFTIPEPSLGQGTFKYFLQRVKKEDESCWHTIQIINWAQEINYLTGWNISRITHQYSASSGKHWVLTGMIMTTFKGIIWIQTLDVLFASTPTFTTHEIRGFVFLWMYAATSTCHDQQKPRLSLAQKTQKAHLMTNECVSSKTTTTPFEPPSPRRRTWKSCRSSRVDDIDNNVWKTQAMALTC